MLLCSPQTLYMEVCCTKRTHAYAGVQVCLKLSCLPESLTLFFLYMQSDLLAD